MGSNGCSNNVNRDCCGIGSGESRAWVRRVTSGDQDANPRKPKKVSWASVVKSGIGGSLPVKHSLNAIPAHNVRKKKPSAPAEGNDTPAIPFKQHE